MVPSPTDADTSGPSSRRTSLSSVGRPSSVSGRSGSGNSSRSTSFNLPNEARGEIRADKRQPGEEVELDDEMDEESWSFISLYVRQPFDNLVVAAARHAAFIRARGRHYSNEAEAMKVFFLHLRFWCSLTTNNVNRGPQFPTTMMTMRLEEIAAVEMHPQMMETNQPKLMA